MATFGRYESVKELYRGKLVTISTAKAIDGDSQVTFAVNVFSPPVDSISAETLKEETQFFLEAAAVQQKVVQEGAEDWVKVHEVGESPNGAYYVSDLHERSVRRLILGQVTLDGHTLHTIVHHVVQGLIELRDACGRPHGDLNPHTIFLVETSGGLVTRALLANPLPSSRVDNEADRVADLRALGELIHELVLHKPLSAIGGWPVPESDQWSSLGRKANDWRELCNRLLDPDLSEQCPTLDEIAERELPALDQPRSHTLPKIALAAVSLAAVAIALGIWALWSPSVQEPVLFEQDKWAKICVAYDDWVGPLYYVGHLQQRLDRWVEDEHLKVVVDQLKKDNAIEVIDPGKIGGLPGGPRTIWAENPTDKAKSEDGTKKTNEAYSIVLSMEAALTDWPPLQQIKETQQQHDRMQWDASADYLKVLLAAAQLKWPSKGEKREDFISAYNTIQLNHEALEDLFGATEEPVETREDFRHLFFVSAVTYLKSTTGPQMSRDPDRFASSLQDLLDLKQRTSDCGGDIQAIQHRIDQISQQFGQDQALEGFQQDLEKYKNNVGSSLGLVEKNVGVEEVARALTGVQKRLVGLMKQVDGFLQSPLNIVDPRVLFADMDDVVQIRSLIKILQGYRDQQQAGQLQNELARSEAQAQELNRLNWIRLHQKEIETGWPTLGAELASLRQRVGDRVEFLAQPLAGADPRDDLEGQVVELADQIQVLAKFNETLSNQHAQQLEKVSGRLEQSRQEYPKWIRAYEQSVSNDVGATKQQLDRLDQEIFPQLDPRRYSQWENLAQEVAQELPNSDASPEVRQQFTHLTQQLTGLDSEVWSAGNRSHIEDLHRELLRQLDEVAGLVISDQRNLFRKRWEQLSVQIETVLRFRREESLGGDPDNERLASTYQSIEAQKNQFENQAWPDDTAERSKIRAAVRNLSQRLDTFYQQLDPRPLWDSQTRRWTKDIREGIGQLKSKKDSAVREHQQQLKDLVAMRSQGSWQPETQQKIINEIRQKNQSFQALYQTVYSKLDPRLQVAWDQVASQITQEISRLEQSDKTAARELSNRMANTLRAVDRLNQKPFDPQEKVQTENQVTDLQSQLLGVYISAIQKAPRVDGVLSETVNRAWLQRRQELVKKQHLVDALQGDINELRIYLRACEARLSNVVVGETQPRGWQPELANQAVMAKRENVLSGVFKLWLSGQAPWKSVATEGRWQQAVKGYDQWRADVGAMKEDFRAIELAFENAYGLHDVLVGYTETVGQLAAQWRQRQEIFVPFQKVIGPVLDVIRNLEEIDGLDQPLKLLDWANRGKSDLDPGVTFAAWRRLGVAGQGVWPANIDQLKQEQDLRHWLHAMIRDSIDSDTQRQLLGEELREQGHQRWTRCLSQLSSGESLEEAIGLMDQFSVNTDRLKPQTLFDLRLYALKQTIAQLPDDSSPEQIRSEFEQFEQDVSDLPENLSHLVEVQAFLNQSKQLLATKAEDENAVPDLAEAGPAASSAWDDLAWKRQESDDRVNVTYSWTLPNGKEHVLEFIRIDAGPQVSKTFYMGTTEVPFGLVQDLFKSLDKWEHLKGLLDPSDWRGPRVWRWRSRKLRLNKHKKLAVWTPPDTRLKSGGGQISDYAEGIEPDGPGEEYPMQYLSPEAAIYFARLLGCRLPSSGEWGASLETEMSGVSLEQHIRDQQPNLRDETWSRQNEYVQEPIRQGVRIYPPSSGGFWEGVSDTGAMPYDDGVLWFDRVKPSRVAGGRLFHHLVGNVAEFVFENSGRLDTLDVMDLKSDQVLGAIRSVTQSGDVGVIGGSAQSPTSVAIDQAQPVTSQTAGSVSVYSDIGFRLAFSAPRQSLRAQLSYFLSGKGYLTTGMSSMPVKSTP